MFSEALLRVVCVCVHRQDGGTAKVSVASSLGSSEEEEVGKNSALIILIVSKRVAQHFSHRFAFSMTKKTKVRETK